MSRPRRRGSAGDDRSSPRASARGGGHRIVRSKGEALPQPGRVDHRVRQPARSTPGLIGLMDFLADQAHPAETPCGSWVTSVARPGGPKSRSASSSAASSGRRNCGSTPPAVARASRVHLIKPNSRRIECPSLAVPGRAMTWRHRPSRGPVWDVAALKEPDSVRSSVRSRDAFA